MIKLISNPKFVLIGIIAMCALALASAYTAQYAFGLMPCDLCEYQRVPFWAAIIIAVFGLLSKSKKHWFVAVCAIVFAANSALAFYHFGVEQHWWKSFLEGCSFSAANISQMISSAAVPCDTPQWIDPIFGMSMAFYNILFCAGAAGACAVSTIIVIARRL